MNWSPADLSKATSRPKHAQARPAASAAPVSLVAGPASRQGAVKPAFSESPAAPCTYLVGPYAVSVGGRLHAEQLPDRIRVVITGPASDDLPAALVAALTQFIQK